MKLWKYCQISVAVNFFVKFVAYQFHDYICKHVVISRIKYNVLKFKQTPQQDDAEILVS